jgi:hypothetical protein
MVHFTYNIPPSANIKNYVGDGLMVLIKNERMDSRWSLCADLGNMELS